MDRDREARRAAMILAQSEYERRVLGRKVDDDDFEAGWQAALAYVREEQKPVGWFNPWNDVHGYQQVAEQFEGKPGTIPLYATPPLNVSPPEKE